MNNTNQNLVLDFYSNHYKKSSWIDRNINNVANTISSYAKDIGFYKGELTTIDEFKQQLANWNNNGKPLIVYYPLETPTKLACTEEQSAVLEELNNLDLFNGVNNIITTEDIALLKLKYALNAKIYIDNLLTKQSESTVAEEV